MKTTRKRYDSSADVLPCNECQAGQMHKEYVVFYTWIGDDLITVQDFPAWVCDVCQRREYDIQALNQLSLILSPNAGRGTSRQRRVRRQVAPKAKNPRATQTE